MMNFIPNRSTGAIVAAALGLALTVGLSQQPVGAQGRATGGEPKAENEFKNIKSLQGIPADELIPTMVFFEAALGVGCPYCHDPDGTKRELDTKPQKAIARQMIEMVNTVNKTTFKGKTEVSCFTCHAGRAEPIATPNVTGEELPAALGEDFIASLPPATPIPSMNPVQLMDKYIAAVGGTAAAQKTPSLVATGTVTQRRPGRDFPSQQIEITSKAPGMVLTATRAGQNMNLLAYGAGGGWAKAGNGAPRDLRKGETDGTRLEDAFNVPTTLKQMLIEPKMARSEIIDGREMYVVTGRTQNLPRVKAYFAQTNGMLQRLVYYVATPFGPYPTQIDYRDYRDVGGRKVPYQWVISQTRNREYTWAMQDVKAAPADDAKFARPAAGSR